LRSEARRQRQNGNQETKKARAPGNNCGKAGIRNAEDGRDTDWLKKHWCRFGARNAHSLKEAKNWMLICSQIEAIVKQAMKWMPFFT